MSVYKIFIPSSPYYNVELSIEFKPDTLSISSKDFFDMHDALKHVEKSMADVLEASYPEDWKLIMLDEKYGQFLTIGSPQMMECGWNFNYEVTDTQTSVTVTGLR